MENRLAKIHTDMDAQAFKELAGRVKRVRIDQEQYQDARDNSYGDELLKESEGTFKQSTKKLTECVRDKVPFSSPPESPLAIFSRNPEFERLRQKILQRRPAPGQKLKPHKLDAEFEDDMRQLLDIMLLDAPSVHNKNPVWCPTKFESSTKGDSSEDESDNFANVAAPDFGEVARRHREQSFEDEGVDMKEDTTDPHDYDRLLGLTVQQRDAGKPKPLLWQNDAVPQGDELQQTIARYQQQSGVNAAVKEAEDGDGDNVAKTHRKGAPVLSKEDDSDIDDNGADQDSSDEEDEMLEPISRKRRVIEDSEDE